MSKRKLKHSFNYPNHKNMILIFNLDFKKK